MVASLASFSFKERNPGDLAMLDAVITWTSFAMGSSWILTELIKVLCSGKFLYVMANLLRHSAGTTGPCSATETHGISERDNTGAVAAFNWKHRWDTIGCTDGLQQVVCKPFYGRLQSQTEFQPECFAALN